MTHSPLSPHSPPALSARNQARRDGDGPFSVPFAQTHIHLVHLTLAFTTSPSTEDATPLALSSDALHTHAHTHPFTASIANIPLALSGPSPHFSSRRRPKSTAKPRATSREHSTHIHQDQGMCCYSPTIMAFPRYSNLPKIEKSGDVVGTARRV
ncbi:hypothetical protein COCC4DRAFT_181098 [Bipolaris maydis ATCC 48331]|uniref:Uncharacterized protein n=2 Tax=Cochliobolus heterostrophus TaxID=5016 RepID=M2SJC6_COCH5|nr:uncharacterized protein COCC4DRAFT_181098 [Bipolaris maydis ATCC 48331]EMD85425.1 hypothetical protein COCHEDRAFT_1207904 [Bipolaris maydis C5]KAJ5024639.1 hypothetical protein J3E73DRAFT_424617 [Bipolaris maydis]ENH99434.1 hypothetical protein COCC4DRAFT_181098 [Bipolaris maydis ATCC 48331]KAJ6266360.1 hypothetical protein PSV08DRAFT_405593 [Bipolaris maydis]KAJ6281373.1 hypothetical protein J3E71DRAFT_400204 [Bipolaris maydis]